MTTNHTPTPADERIAELERALSNLEIAASKVLLNMKGEHGVIAENFLRYERDRARATLAKVA